MTNIENIDADVRANSDLEKVSFISRRQEPEVLCKEIRTSLGMTQSDFASNFGLSLNSIRNWEQGTRSPDRNAKSYLIAIKYSTNAVLPTMESSRNEITLVMAPVAKKKAVSKSEHLRVETVGPHDELAQYTSVDAIFSDFDVPIAASSSKGKTKLVPFLKIQFDTFNADVFGTASGSILIKGLKNIKSGFISFGEEKHSLCWSSSNDGHLVDTIGVAKLQMMKARLEDAVFPTICIFSASLIE